MTNVKSSKKLTIAASAALAAAVLVNNGQAVKADQVTNPDKDNPSKATQVTETPEEAAQKADASYTQASQNLSKAQDAKTAADSVKQIADNNVKSAQEDVNKAKQAVANAQDSVNEAQKGGIDKAQTALKHASQDVTNAQNNESKAQEGVDTANKDVQTAQKSYDTQAGAVKQAQDKKSQAQTDYDQARDAYNNTNLAKAQESVKTADQNVQTAQDNANKASSEKSNADQAVKNAQDNVTKTTSADTAAKKDLDTKTQNASTAKTTLDKANTVVNTANQAVKDAQGALDSLSSSDKITINQDYVKFFKDLDKTYRNGLAEAGKQDAAWDSAHPDEVKKNGWSTKYQDAFMDKMNKIIEGKDKNDAQVKQIQAIVADLYKNNTYKGSKADHNRVIDLDHITDAQLLELNKYALGLINDVQRQAGRPEYQLSDGSIKVAQAVADQYTQDHWSGQEKAHDYAALNAGSNADKKYGISNLAENMSDDFAGYASMQDAPLSDNGGQYIVQSDDQSRLNLPDNKVTMYDLKGSIYDGLRAMYFNNREWAHATNFLALANANQDGTAKTYHMGVSISRVGNGSNEYDVHYNIFTDFDVNLANGKYQNGNVISTDPSKDVKTAQDNLNKANQNLTDAKNAQKTAQSENDKAQNDLKSAQEAYATAETNKKSTEDALTKAQANAKTAEDTLTKANAALADAKTAQKSAHEALAKYQATSQDKLKAMQSAKTVLDNANKVVSQEEAKLAQSAKALADAKAKSETAQKALDDAKAAVQTAKDNLAKAQAHLTDMQHAPEKLAEAQKNEVAAEANLKTAQAKQAEAAKAVESAQEAVTKAQKAFDTAKIAKDKADETLAQKRAQEEAKNSQDSYFNAVLDNTQKEITKQETENKGKTVTEDVPATPAKRIHTYKMTIKNGHLYYRGRRVTAKSMSRMLAKRAKFSVKGHTLSLRKVTVYSSKGKKLAKHVRLYKIRKVLGFKKIGKHVYVQISKKFFVRFNDYFK